MYDKTREKRALPAPGAAEETDGLQDGIIAGRNAVSELLKSGRTVDKIFVASGSREGSIRVIVGKAIALGIPVVEAERRKLDEMCGPVNHQGVVALAAEKEYCTIDDILQIAQDRGEMPFIVACDGIEDPHNLGALIRCAEGAGAHGVIIPKRRTATVTAAVARTSAGALEHIAVCKVPSIRAAIDELKKKGVWVYGAEAGGSSVYGCDCLRPSVFVFGSEGSGLSKPVAAACDYIVSIDMYGKVNSFNVSCAAAVILCEAAHKRHETAASE